MKRLLPSCLLLLAAIGLFLIATHDKQADDKRAGDAGSATAENGTGPDTTASSPAESAASTSSSADDAADAGGPGRSELPPELAGRTTWTAPYSPSYWHATGWRFDEDALVAESAKPTGSEAATADVPCTAEFLRDWHTVSAGWQVRFPSGADEASAAGPRSQRLVLELTGLEVSATLRVTLQPGRAVAESVIDGQATVLREIGAEYDLDSVHVRLLLTPNRLLLRVDDQLLLNAPRPAALTGTRCRFRMAAPPGTIVSGLRFDGE